MATVEEYFVATGAETIGSGGPDPAEVQAVVDLFEPYGRVTWFNGVVYKVADSGFTSFVANQATPYVDLDFIQTANGPAGETAQSSNQITVFDNEVIWTGHDVTKFGGTGFPWVMVFSFDADSTRISTLYVSRGDVPYWAVAVDHPWTGPLDRDACLTYTAEEVLQSGWSDTGACIHFWVLVTAIEDTEYGPCRGFTGIYGGTPENKSTEPLMTITGSRRTCVKTADVEVGDRVEVWGYGHPLLGFSAADIEVTGRT